MLLFLLSYNFNQKAKAEARPCPIDVGSFYVFGFKSTRMIKLIQVGKRAANNFVDIVDNPREWLSSTTVQFANQSYTKNLRASFNIAVMKGQEQLLGAVSFSGSSEK